MEMTIRPIRPEDAEACGRVAYEAHKGVAAAHNFPPEYPSIEFSVGLIQAKLKDPNAWGALAERGGHIIGSIFLNTFSSTPVAAIGPLTVQPAAEGAVGRRLMNAALEESRQRRLERVRLVQSPSHIRSLVLYAKLGFDVREPLLLMQGKPPRAANLRGRQVRAAVLNDLPICNQLCVAVHGFAREMEVRLAIEQGGATVVEHTGRITGYATGIGFRGHAVGEETEDLKALIGHAPMFLGPGFFIPSRNGDLLRWLLGVGLRVGWPAMLMTIGQYQEPAGVFLPSIAF